MNLKLKRVEKNLTQQQLAEKIGVDRTLVSKIECGAASPSVGVAKRIASALGFDWTLFYEDDTDADPQSA